MGVGLDIGGRNIKIVELAHEGSGFRLVGAGVVGHNYATPELFVSDKNTAELAAVVKKLHSDARISHKKVSLSLPENQVFTRTVRYPLLTDQEIASAVKWEAEQYLPIPKEEAIVQHQILERQEGGNQSGVVVLLIAAPKLLVEKYIKVAQVAGLSVVAVETELISAARVLAPSQGTYLLVDFGARSTDMAICKNGNLWFSRSISTSGEAFTRALSQALGIDVRQAEEYKRSYGLSKDQLEGKVRNVLMPVFSLVADEIKKAIHFYQSEQKGDPPQSIILTGGSAGLPGCVSELSSALGVEVILANPFARTVVSEESAKSLAGYSTLYSIAVGLALREE